MCVLCVCVCELWMHGTNEQLCTHPWGEMRSQDDHRNAACSLGIGSELGLGLGSGLGSGSGSGSVIVVGLGLGSKQGILASQWPLTRSPAVGILLDNTHTYIHTYIHVCTVNKGPQQPVNKRATAASQHIHTYIHVCTVNKGPQQPVNSCGSPVHALTPTHTYSTSTHNHTLTSTHTHTHTLTHTHTPSHTRTHTRTCTRPHALPAGCICGTLGALRLAPII